VQIALELQVVGRIGEDQVDRRLGQRAHHLDAIARKIGIQRQRPRLRPS
jgi:hypothetical protein